MNTRVKVSRSEPLQKSCLVQPSRASVRGNRRKAWGICTRLKRLNRRCPRKTSEQTEWFRCRRQTQK